MWHGGQVREGVRVPLCLRMSVSPCVGVSVTVCVSVSVRVVLSCVCVCGDSGCVRERVRGWVCRARLVGPEELCWGWEGSQRTWGSL